jgi:hypothetical protein
VWLPSQPKGEIAMTEQIPAPPGQSLGNVILNVFSSPGDAFSDLAQNESKPSLWLVTLILSIVIASLFTFVMFSNESLRTQFLETQNHAIQKQVDSGKLTAEQGDQARSRMENMGGMFIVIGIIGSVVVIAIAFFGATLVLWLVGKLALKSPTGYGKYLELYGISTWIGILGGIVTLLMVLGLNTMYATPSAALAIYGSFDPLNTTHKLLAALNIFSVWQAAVIGIGISKFSNKSSGVGIGVTLGLWIVWVLVQVFLLNFGR